ncbi:hypothetical protein BRADI_2g10756v3 [Brachypodium distachyon]|uniref:Uncharacterized protein n=1 Tax=Brachypodium distachyon TaxID=15368 RepID=A0A2K2D7V2_BRADI|nr:hypothetical protein BRADI_2g10756v3 [Brachypodium distachyon]
MSPSHRDPSLPPASPIKKELSHLTLPVARPQPSAAVASPVSTLRQPAAAVALHSSPPWPVVPPVNRPPSRFARPSLHPPTARLRPPAVAESPIRPEESPQ